MEEYNCNIEFKEYVDRYCDKHHITPEEATRHLIVRGVEGQKRKKREEGTYVARY